MPRISNVWPERRLVGRGEFARATPIGRCKLAVRPEFAFALDFAGKIRLYVDGMLAAVDANRSQQATYSLIPA